MTDRLETDPTRIAQLLASEVTGRDRGPLGHLAVVDAEQDATPSAAGSLAYRLARSGADDGSAAADSATPVGGDGSATTDCERTGDQAETILAAVHLQPDAVVVALPGPGGPEEARLSARTVAAGTDAAPTARDVVDVERTHNGLRIEIRTGAGVKPAVDVLAAVVDADRRSDDPGQ